MLPRNSRLMFFVLLIALLVVAPVWAVSGPDLTTSITHTGNTGPSNVNYTTGGTGTVTVVVTNHGDTVTDGSAITVTVTLAGGLTGSFNSSTGLFVAGDCSGTTTVTCTSSGGGTLAATGGADTLVLNVTAPGTASTGNINQADVSGGGEPSANNIDNISTDPQTFDVIAPIVDMKMVSVTHTGTVGNNYLINSTTGTVSVTIQNIGAVASSGTVTVNVVLSGGLTYNVFGSSTPGGRFSSCSGTTIVSCSTGVAFNAGDSETITFKVTAPSTAGSGFTNSASVFGGNDGDTTDNTLPDSTSFSIVTSATPSATPTGLPSPTLTFPIPTFTPTGSTGTPGTVLPPTAIPSATLIPPPPTRTPVPRPANAGQAVGPIPHPDITIVVDRDNVNVRLYPAIGAELVATVNAGFSTNILARSGDSQWVLVRIGGQLGWIGSPVFVVVNGDLNSAPIADPRTIPYGGWANPRAGITSVTSQYTGKLQNSGLRVRSGPGRAYVILANAPRYTIFSLLGRTADNAWLQVNYEGTLGWVATEFVALQQDLSVLNKLPIDGIVADGVPASVPTGDSYVDTLKFMLARIDLAQPSLDSIRGTWTNIALGGRAQCFNFPARPTDFNIPNPLLAAFYDTLNPLEGDFNTAMSSLRQSIDLLIKACGQPQPPQGLVGQPVVQTALDYTNQTDALFASLRQRITALLPPEGPINNDTECSFTFRNRTEIVPRIHLNEAKIVTLTAKHFVAGLCFDAGAGQSLSVEMLKVNGNAEPRLTISPFDNPTNFIGSTQMGSGETDASVSPILITQTARYIMILADLDGSPTGPLQGDIAVLLTDVTATSGVAPAHLAIDPATGNVITVAGGIVPVTPGINGTSTSGTSNAFPTVNASVVCPSTSFTCDQLTSCDQAYACLRAGNVSLDPDGNGIPCQNLCGG